MRGVTHQQLHHIASQSIRIPPDVMLVRAHMPEAPYQASDSIFPFCFSDKLLALTGQRNAE